MAFYKNTISDKGLRMKKTIISVVLAGLALTLPAAQKLGEFQGGKAVSKAQPYEWTPFYNEGIVPKINGESGITIFDDQTNKGLFVLQRRHTTGTVTQNAPLEFTLTLALSNASVSSLNIFNAGYRPCADGRALVLGWNRDSKDQCTLNLVDVTTNKRLKLLTAFNWNDGKKYNYKLQKYHDDASGKTLVQVYLDDKALLSDPIDYASIPVSGEKGVSTFSFGSSTPETVNVAIENIAYAAGDEIKPVPAAANETSATPAAKLEKYTSQANSLASYNGNYQPNDPAAPVAMRWALHIGSNCKLSVNTPAPGIATIIDDGKVVGTYLNINRAVEFTDPEKEESEFGIEVAFKLSEMSHAPNLFCGFRGEGAKVGKTIALAWYHTYDNKYFIGLMGPSSNMAYPVTNLKWDDGKFRNYQVKKYFDPQSKEMLVQVLIDGKPQFKDPIPYAKLVDSEKGASNFQVGTSSFASVEAQIKSFYYGRLNSIPPRAAENTFEMTPAILTVTLDKWEKGETGVWTSHKFDLVPNRNYMVTGELDISGTPQEISVKYLQLSGNYSRPIPPTFEKKLTEFKSGRLEFKLPVHQRLGNESCQIEIAVIGDGKISSAKIELSGETKYDLSFIPSQREKAKCTSQEILTAANNEKQVSIQVKPTLEQMAFTTDAGGYMPPFFHVGPLKTSSSLGHWGAFESAGVKLQSVHHSGTEEYPAFWQGKDKYNFAGVREILELVLRRAPDSKIIFGIWLDPYREWGDQNLSEVCMNRKGEYASGTNHFGNWVKSPQKNQQLLPSIFSAKAVSDIVKMLTALDVFLANDPLGKRVVGYYIWGFNDADFGHWVHPATSKVTELDDYSPAAIASWHEWLKKRYSSINELNTAWGKKYASFNEIELPTPEERRTKSDSGFPWLIDREYAYLVDFNRFYGETPSNFISEIIKGFQQQRGTEKYFMVHNGNAMHGWRGYTGFGLQSKVEGLKAISATSDYSVRQSGYPGGCDSFPETLRLQNKIFFHEFDYRSHAEPSEAESFDFAVGRSFNSANHRALLFREASNMLARGQGLYCMDMSGKWYGNADIMKGVADIYKVFADGINCKDAPEADVAYFLGEDSINFLCDDLEASRFLMRNTRRHRPQWDTSGVPYHLYLQRDITDKHLPDYKVYVFLMPEKITTEEMAAIEKLKGNNNTLVFLHAPGICDSSGKMEEAVEKVTGIKCKKIGQVALAGKWLKSKNPLLNNLAGSFGDTPIPWIFCDRESRGLGFAITDPEAQPLASYRDSNDVAGAVKNFNKWRSIYLTVPWLDAQFINNIAKTAGAWSAGEQSGDAVYGNQYLIGIHAATGGMKALYPKYRSDIFDAITGEAIAQNVISFKVNIPFGETKIFKTVATKKEK